MDWTLARERLGAELIGAREDVAALWRHLLRDQGVEVWTLERCAAELVAAGRAAILRKPAGSQWTSADTPSNQSGQPI
jgi:hypothetical protein